MNPTGIATGEDACGTRIHVARASIAKTETCSRVGALSTRSLSLSVSLSDDSNRDQDHCWWLVCTLRLDYLWQDQLDHHSTPSLLSSTRVVVEPGLCTPHSVHSTLVFLAWCLFYDVVHKSDGMFSYRQDIQIGRYCKYYHYIVHKKG